MFDLHEPEDDGWIFHQSSTNIVEHNLPALDLTGMFDWRRPIVYDTKNDVVHVGSPGSHHGQILRKLPDLPIAQTRAGMIAHGPSELYNRAPGDYEWYDPYESDEPLLRALNHFGIERNENQNAPSSWTFGKTASLGWKWVYMPDDELRIGDDESYHHELHGYSYPVATGVVSPNGECEFWIEPDDETKQKIAEMLSQRLNMKVTPTEGYEFGWTIAKTASVDYAPGRNHKGWYDPISDETLLWPVNERAEPHHHEIDHPITFTHDEAMPFTIDSQGYLRGYWADDRLNKVAEDPALQAAWHPERNAYGVVYDHDVDNSWRFGHVINYRPGGRHKGLVYNNEVYVWPTSQGSPHHSEMLGSLTGMNPEDVPDSMRENAQPFTISDNKVTNALDWTPVSPEIQEALKPYGVTDDPQADDSWRFGLAEPNDEKKQRHGADRADEEDEHASRIAHIEYEPGQYHKGLVHNGEVYVWPTDDMGNPHHGEIIDTHDMAPVDESWGIDDHDYHGLYPFVVNNENELSFIDRPHPKVINALKPLGVKLNPWADSDWRFGKASRSLWVDDDQKGSGFLAEGADLSGDFRREGSDSGIFLSTPSPNTHSHARACAMKLSNLSPVSSIINELNEFLSADNPFTVNQTEFSDGEWKDRFDIPLRQQGRPLIYLPRLNKLLVGGIGSGHAGLMKVFPEHLEDFMGDDAIQGCIGNGKYDLWNVSNQDEDESEYPDLHRWLTERAEPMDRDNWSFSSNSETSGQSKDESPSLFSFSSVAPIDIINVPTTDNEWQDSGITPREQGKPFIYMPSTSKLYVGPVGSGHQALVGPHGVPYVDYYDHPVHGWMDDNNKTYEVFNRPNNNGEPVHEWMRANGYSPYEWSFSSGVDEDKHAHDDDSEPKHHSKCNTNYCNGKCRPSLKEFLGALTIRESLNSVDNISKKSSHKSSNMSDDGHKLWWKPGNWGRGMITPNGFVHTWPEEEADHSQHAMAFGFDPFECTDFHISPEGQVTSDLEPEDEHILTEADPNLHHVSRIATSKSKSSNIEPSDRAYWNFSHRSPNGTDELGSLGKTAAKKYLDVDWNELSNWNNENLPPESAASFENKLTNGHGFEGMRKLHDFYDSRLDDPQWDFSPYEMRKRGENPQDLTDYMRFRKFIDKSDFSKRRWELGAHFDPRVSPYGKGIYFDNGELHTWNTGGEDDERTGHPGYLSAFEDQIGAKPLVALGINPDLDDEGNETGLRGWSAPLKRTYRDKPDWDVPPEFYDIAKQHHPQVNWKPDEEWNFFSKIAAPINIQEVEAGPIPEGWSIRGLEKRRPFLYHHPSQTVYLGPPGAYHAQILHHAPVQNVVPGWVDLENREADSMGAPDAVRAVAEYLGPEYKAADDWNLSKVATQIKEHDFQTGIYFPNRRPMIYNPAYDTLHIGPNGAFHEDLADKIWHRDGEELAQDYRGWIGENPEQIAGDIDKGSYGWYTDPPPHVDELIRSHLGLRPEENDWKFGARIPVRVIPFENATLPEGDPTSFSGQTPFIFGSNHVVIGNPGMYHSQMWDEIGTQSQLGRNLETHGWITSDNEINANGDIPHRIRDAIEQHFGQKFTDPEQWVFGRITTQPGYEDFDDEFGSELIPWEPGSYGKGYLDTNHEPFVWKIEGDTEEGDAGSPHHWDVADYRDPGGFTHAIFIHPDGSFVSGSFHNREFDTDSYKKFKEFHPDLHLTQDEGWDFSAKVSFDYDGPLTNPVAKLNFPLGWEDKKPNHRVPFLYTTDKNDRNDINIYLGHPGSEHADIEDPGGSRWSYQDQDYIDVDPMHPKLYDRLYDGDEEIGGYGSIKPQSWYTGEPADSGLALEYYSTPQAHALKEIANAIAAHPTFELPPQNFNNYEKRNPSEEDDWYFEGRASSVGFNSGSIKHSNNLMWVPGNTGKGFVAGNNLYTWNTGGSGQKPHHYDMWETFRKRDPNISTMTAAFRIDPSGATIQEYGDPKDIKPFLSQDPRLHWYDEPQWNFAKTATGTENWTPGNDGKGMVIDGQIHTWNVDNSGFPHHFQYWNNYLSGKIPDFADFDLKGVKDAQNQHAVYIDPDGSIDPLDRENPYTDRFARSTGGRITDQDNSWNFSSVKPYCPICKGFHYSEEPHQHLRDYREQESLWYNADPNMGAQPVMSKTAGIMDYAENLHPDTLIPYREYDWSSNNNRDGSEAWDALRDDVAANGFREPVMLMYNPNSGEAYVGEGNHRIGIAKELGIPVPTVIYRSTKESPTWPMKPITKPGQYKYPNQYGHSQFGQYEKPSRIGLPIWNPTQPKTSALAWQPGNHGKGFYDPWGDALKTWNLDTDDFAKGPHHEEMGMDTDGDDHPIWIEPDGNFQTAPYRGDPEELDRYNHNIMRLDPRLKYQKSDRWTFGKTAELDDLFDEDLDNEFIDRMMSQPENIREIINRGYKPGGYGKGLVLPDGREFRWNLDKFSEPHHHQVLQELGINPNVVPIEDQYDIDPKGERINYDNWGFNDLEADSDFV